MGMTLPKQNTFLKDFTSLFNFGGLSEKNGCDLKVYHHLFLLVTVMSERELHIFKDLFYHFFRFSSLSLTDNIQAYNGFRKHWSRNPLEDSLHRSTVVLPHTSSQNTKEISVSLEDYTPVFLSCLTGKFYRLPQNDHL